MKRRDIVCPICGTMNMGIDIEETDGWMECEHCAVTVRYMNDCNSYPIDNCQWQLIQRLPCRR